MTLKEKYLYERALTKDTKEVYIDVINKINDLKACAYLLNKYLLCALLYDINSSKLEKILYCYFDEYETGNLKKNDFEYLAEIGLKNSILYYYDILIKKDKSSKLIDVASVTKIYDKNVFNFLNEKNSLGYLYDQTKDNSILHYVLEDTITPDIYNCFVRLLNVDYKEKFLDKMMKDNKVVDIIRAIHPNYNKDVLNGWRKCKEHLSIRDIDAIVEREVYEKEDIEFLVNKSCELMDAENIYLFLSGEYLITSELNINQKQKLEKALKSTNDIEYNFYYDFHNNKDELIRKLGGISALLIFLNKYKGKIFRNSEENKKIYKILESKCEENIPDDSLHDKILFADYEKQRKVVAKRIKKQNKPCNN